MEAEAAVRPRTRITRLVEEVETFRKNGKELSIRNEEKAKLQVRWFAKERGDMELCPFPSNPPCGVGLAPRLKLVHCLEGWLMGF